MLNLADLERVLVARLDADEIKFPPYPAVATKIEQLSRQAHSTTQELATVVSSDPTLAAAVIGRANSAAQAGRGTGRIATLLEALHQIGTEPLIEMALTTGIGNGAVAVGPLAELRRDNWWRALLGAYLARMLAGTREIASDTAYLAGLLYELGAVVATSAIEDIAKAQQLPALPETEWRAFVANLQDRFGRAIATRWNLPHELADVVAHDAPETELGKLLSLVAQIVARLDSSTTTGVAAALVDIDGLGEIERCSIGSVVQDVVRSMGAFTIPTPSPPRVVVPAPKPAAEAFPVAFEVTAAKQRGHARTLGSNGLVFDAAQPIAPSWLVELTLHTEEPIEMLAHVLTCTKDGARHLIEVKPFALEGVALERWVQLLLAARESAP